jgi:ribonuclease HII
MSKTASLSFERDLIALGCRAIAGLDEVGRGAWAGPVVAGAVVLPLDRADLLTVLDGARDSKDMTARARAALVDRIQGTALAWGVGRAEAAEIDTLGIVPATCLAMDRALEVVRQTLAPDFLLLDSIRWRDLDRKGIPHLALIRGDSLSLSIAAASILAKVQRDQWMVEYDALYPQYGFSRHKGYGVPQHAGAIAQHGACPIHRMSFAPLARRLF